MKVIFLDFDGVLNSPATWGLMPRDRAIDADKVARLAALVERLDASVVLSTSWRHAHEFETMQDILASKGLPKHRVIGETPFDREGNRAIEIALWLKSELPMRPTFAILDDMGLSCFEGLGRHLVQVDGSRGLTDDDCKSVERVLLGRSIEETTGAPNNHERYNAEDWKTWEIACLTTRAE